MINSIESERLQRLIDRKTAQYEKLKSEDPEKKALLYLSSEITLLRDTIMPIVLTNTVYDYTEIRNFVTKSMRRIENSPHAKEATDIMFHFRLKDTEGERKCYFISNDDDMDIIMDYFSIETVKDRLMESDFFKNIIYPEVSDKTLDMNTVKKLKELNGWEW